MLRIGLLTSGGDCQALNATMRGIVKTLMTNSEEPIEIYGFEDGYQGLIYSRFRVMTPADFSGILTRGGTILGTSRTPFKRWTLPRPTASRRCRRWSTPIISCSSTACLCWAATAPPRPPTACARGPQRYRPAQDHR